MSDRDVVAFITYQIIDDIMYQLRVVIDLVTSVIESWLILTLYLIESWFMLSTGLSSSLAPLEERLEYSDSEIFAGSIAVDSSLPQTDSI